MDDKPPGYFEKIFRVQLFFHPYERKRNPLWLRDIFQVNINALVITLDFLHLLQRESIIFAVRMNLQIFFRAVKITKETSKQFPETVAVYWFDKIMDSI